MLSACAGKAVGLIWFFSLRGFLIVVDLQMQSR